MMLDHANASPANLLLEAPVLVPGLNQALWLSADGEIEDLAFVEAARRAAQDRPIVCHGRAVARKLKLNTFAAADILELFVFAFPARFVLPTPEGLARFFQLPVPLDLSDKALSLRQVATRILDFVGQEKDPGQIRNMRRLAARMGAAGWAWAASVQARLGPEEKGGIAKHAGFDIWNRIPAWENYAPPPPPSDHPVSEAEARGELLQVLGPDAEARPPQFDYAAQITTAFQPRQQVDQPNLVLAEAGTGIGKTLGYLAPARLWAERNQGTVWISTYTKNLQRQVDQELSRFYPEEKVKRARTVIRKGRENYLCLLNFEDAVSAAFATSPRHIIGLALMARWAEASRDGDMVGGDFPSWLVDILGRGPTLGLTDQRGECVYSACGHYQKCFIENSRRKSERARIVVANHALVMLRAARGLDQDGIPPTRFVFDEGHHLFDAADGAFAAHIDGQEGAELRRWILGPETGRRAGRARGLEARIEDLLGGLADGGALLELIKRGAMNLPAHGWLRRLAEGGASGAYEKFLHAVRQFVIARAARDEGFSLEAEVIEPPEEVLLAAQHLYQRLNGLAEPLAVLARGLNERLDHEAEDLGSNERLRLDAAARGLLRRRDGVEAWRHMLNELSGPTPPAFVDWFTLSRSAGREVDVGMYRHWVDPTIPFAETLLKKAHGVVVTSATLRDSGPDMAPDAADDWRSAEIRTGALHMPMVAARSGLKSPFDYGKLTRVFVVTDVARDDADQVAAAYRELIMAAGGGVLGLFTAIHRLRATHQRLAPACEAAGIPLLAQHVDAMDTGTLVDIFRAEKHACLLGTDAVRDGVDVPGRSLRLIIFDRVPWPRPDILHRARRAEFGGNRYDDMLTRLRLKQAFGRLVRRGDDQGVFVMLDARTPSRLLAALPEEVVVERLGLAEAVTKTREFLSTPPAASPGN